MTDQRAKVSLELLEDGKIRVRSDRGSMTTDEAGLMQLSKDMSRRMPTVNEDEDIVGIFAPYLVEFKIGNEGDHAKESWRQVEYDFFLKSLGNLLDAALDAVPAAVADGIEIKRKK